MVLIMKIIDSMLISKSVKLDRSPDGPLTITIARNNMMPQTVPAGSPANAFITIDLSVSQNKDGAVTHIGDVSVKYMLLADLEGEPYEIQSCAENIFALSKVLFFHTINSLLCDVRLPPISIAQLDTSRG